MRAVIDLRAGLMIWVSQIRRLRRHLASLLTGGGDYK
jgi:hypothetical protein